MRPLHGGRHSLPADLVAHDQRERLLAALATDVAEVGYNKTTVTRIIGIASVSRRTFYENFADKEACFLAAYDALDEYIAGVMKEAAEEEKEWPEQVGATFFALVDFLASRPNFARLYLVEAAAVGEGMASRREATADRFIALLEPGREYRGEGRPLADGIEEALVGGVVTLLARRILAGEAERLDEVLPSVVEFALAPYLGGEEAHRLASNTGPRGGSPKG
jgi:AcrR family transcriptional regulator